MIRFYALFITSAMLGACNHAEPNPLSACDDHRMVQACDNWTPGYVALCYANEPGASPAPSCGWLPSNRFGAPDPQHISDASDDADWWCCPSEMPTGCDASPEGCTMSLDGGPQ